MASVTMKGVNELFDDVIWRTLKAEGPWLQDPGRALERECSLLTSKLVRKSSGYRTSCTTDPRAQDSVREETNSRIS